MSPQAEAGRFTFEIAPRDGLLEWRDLLSLSEILIEHPGMTVRAGLRRNLFLANAPAPRLSRIVKSFQARGLLRKPQSLAPVLACPGARICKAALCNAPGLANAIGEAIQAGEESSRLKDIPISVSACPSNCSRHLSAAIGFSGTQGRLLGKPAPYYDIWLGGVVREGRTEAAEPLGRLPAGLIVPWLKEFLAPVREGGDAFVDWLRKGGGMRRAAESIRRLAANATQDGVRHGLFTDLGMALPFSPPYAATARAEGRLRDPARRCLQRSLAFRNRLAAFAAEPDREAALAAVFRETCRALAILLKVELDPAGFSLQALRDAWAEAATAPAAAALSKLDAVYHKGRKLEPHRTAILHFNFLVENMFHASRAGSRGAAA